MENICQVIHPMRWTNCDRILKNTFAEWFHDLFLIIKLIYQSNSTRFLCLLMFCVRCNQIQGTHMNHTGTDMPHGPTMQKLQPFIMSYNLSSIVWTFIICFPKPLKGLANSDYLLLFISTEPSINDSMIVNPSTRYRNVVFSMAMPMTGVKNGITSTNVQNHGWQK